MEFEKSHLEVGRSLLLDLVGQGVDLEPVQAGDKLVGWPLWPARKDNVKSSPICSPFAHLNLSLVALILLAVVLLSIG